MKVAQHLFWSFSVIHHIYNYCKKDYNDRCKAELACSAVFEVYFVTKRKAKKALSETFKFLKFCSTENKNAVSIVFNNDIKHIKITQSHSK